MTKDELVQFESQLTVLCQKYHVWIREKTQREQQPKDRFCFQEYVLSAKITDNKQITDIVE